VQALSSSVKSPPDHTTAEGQKKEEDLELTAVIGPEMAAARPPPTAEGIGSQQELQAAAVPQHLLLRPASTKLLIPVLSI